MEHGKIPEADRERRHSKREQAAEVPEEDGPAIIDKAAPVDPLLAVTGIIIEDCGTDALVEEMRGSDSQPIGGNERGKGIGHPRDDS